MANSKLESTGSDMTVGGTAASARAGATAGVFLMLLTAHSVDADDPAAPPQCSMVLSVEVTPDVPNPGNGAFISSLLGNHTDYRLYLLRVVDDTHVDLRLEGPGPDERCQAVVDSISNDGRISSIDTSS
jgi:hypothetical protein